MANKKLPSIKQLSNTLLIYSDGGKNRVELLVNGETLWLPQSGIAELFGVQKAAVSKHLANIFKEGELDENSVVSILETTASDRKIYKVKHYNLDAVISVGYRISSSKATQFRIWATRVIREFAVKGFVLDDERLKNGKHFGKDYFKELLERVRSIRASERRIYQQITDIFAECSIDYDKRSNLARRFYAFIQDKFHYAITGKTAAEIVYENADASKPYMGLMSFKHSPEGRVLKSDVTIAKNYLTEDEIHQLERTIGNFFDYLERLIETRNTFTMKAFAESVDRFLAFNEYRILESYKNRISSPKAKEKTWHEYDVFNPGQKIVSDFDALLEENLNTSSDTLKSLQHIAENKREIDENS